MSTCPTCNAHGDAHCVTKSGAKAKKRHANRDAPMETVSIQSRGSKVTITVTPDIQPEFKQELKEQIAPGFERETDKQRYHRLKAEKRAAYEAKKAQRRALAGAR